MNTAPPTSQAIQDRYWQIANDPNERGYTQVAPSTRSAACSTCSPVFSSPMFPAPARTRIDRP